MKYLYRITTSVVIVNEKKEVLLGKRSSTEDTLQGFWSIPGGKLELAEHALDVLENNAIKEVLEEFGVTVGVLTYLDSHLWATDESDKKVTIVFKGVITSGAPKPLEDTDEVEWFSLEEIKKIKLPPNVFRVIEKALSENS